MLTRSPFVAFGMMTLFAIFAGRSEAADWRQYTVSSIDSMTSETVKSAPSGAPDTRTDIGLREKVTCSIDSGTWSDLDCDKAIPIIITDTIGDRVWAVAGDGSINPSGVTSVDSVTLTASDDPGTVTVWVSVYDSETRYDDDPLYTSKFFTVKKPTGETTVFDEWRDDEWGHYAGFESTLTPTSVSFGRIKVVEQDGGEGSDDCWFYGCIYEEPILHLHGGTSWDVNDDNTWGNDYLGILDTMIIYYRNNPDPPSAACQITLNQDMHVLEGSSGKYTGDQNIFYIGTTIVGYTRNDEPVVGIHNP